jgi:hypothetical protein
MSGSDRDRDRCSSVRRDRLTGAGRQSLHEPAEKPPDRALRARRQDRPLPLLPERSAHCSGLTGTASKILAGILLRHLTDRRREHFAEPYDIGCLRSARRRRVRALLLDRCAIHYRSIISRIRIANASTAKGLVIISTAIMMLLRKPPMVVPNRQSHPSL